MLSPAGQHLNTQRTNPESAKIGFFLTLFPAPLPHDGKPATATKWLHRDDRQEEMICLGPAGVERVDVKPAVEHPEPLTHPVSWYLMVFF